MTAQAITAIQKSNISAAMKAVLIAQLEGPAEAKPTVVKAVGTLVCEDCGTTTPRNSLNQKRCPSCREAKAQGSNVARTQWREAKAAADLKHGKGKGIPEWGVPVLMTMAQALDAGLVVIDGEGNLGPATAKAPKAKKAKKAKAPKAAKVEVVEEVDAVLLEQARILVEVGGFTIEEAARLVVSRPVA